MLNADQQEKGRALFAALPPRFIGIPAVLAFVGIALFRWDVVTEVEYREALVLEVIQVPGKSMSDRLVVVDLGDRPWPLRTSDPYLRLREGEQACVAKRRMLLRRWQRYSLELSGYCFGARRLKPAPLSRNAPSYPQGSGGVCQGPEPCALLTAPTAPVRP